MENTTVPLIMLNISLWVAQTLLFVMYGSAGVMKLTMPIPELAKMIPWTPDVPLPLVRFIGACELAGAIGLMLPSLTRIKPVLTPVAALCLTIVMVLAIGFHISRGEFDRLPMVASLGALAAFIAWGRFRRAPIAARA